MPTSPEQYVKEKGWRYKLRGGEQNGRPQINLEVCPLCGKDKWHFFINKESGQWDCKACQACGRSLVSLKYHSGDLVDPIAVPLVALSPRSPAVDTALVRKLHGALWRSPEALGWCRDRGWQSATIRQFRLGFEDGWIVFPYFNGGRCVNLKYRAMDRKAFRWIPGYDKPLYCADNLEDQTEAVLTEGESDLISLWQAGCRPVVGLPNGAGSFGPEHWEPLVRLKRIYLALDNDVAGHKGAQRIADRLGPDRSYRVIVDRHKDVRDYLAAGGDWVKLLAGAAPCGEPTVLKAASAVRRIMLLSQSRDAGYKTPWPPVNRHVPPLAPGQMLSLVGISKQGKTTFAAQWLCWLAMHEQVPCFLYCVDMDLASTVDMLVSHVLRVSRSDLTDGLRSQALMYLHRVPLYVSSYAPEMTIDSVCEQIELAVLRYGIEVVCFDHLHNLCRGVENYFGAVSLASARFKEIAQRLKIGMIVLHQPTKLAKGQEPDLYSASGSSMIPADSDTILSLYRKPIKAADEDEIAGTFEPKTKVMVLGSRHSRGGFCHLWLKEEYATFALTSNGTMPPVRCGLSDGWRNETGCSG